MVDSTSPVGVLAFQGDFQKHLELLSAMGRRAVAVRSPEDIANLSALIIPGGESTTIGMLMERFGLIEPVRNRARDGMPVLGTCAGAILLAREIDGSDQPRIGIMDIDVRRNAYGRQIESFEADIELGEPANRGSAAVGAGSGAGLGTGDRGASAGEPENHGSVRAVFIRAPIITRVGSGVDVLARFEDYPVVVREGNMMAATFHPELSGETAVHRLFLQHAGT
jgi:5'-phosphate synthase pdxT subunit